MRLARRDDGRGGCDLFLLPAGGAVRAVWTNEIIPNAKPGSLVIDCSTIDVESARAVAAAAVKAGLRAADAPVSGGIMAADAGTLAFMVGAEDADYAAVEAVLTPAQLEKYQELRGLRPTPRAPEMQVPGSIPK